MAQYNETSFPSLGGGGSSSNDWDASDDAEPQPSAKLGPVNHTSAPPAPPKLASPPAALYRESKRVPAAPQPPPGGFYPPGNVRMAPVQAPPVKAPPAAVPRVPPVPRSAAPPPPPPPPYGKSTTMTNGQGRPLQFHPMYLLYALPR